VHLILQRLDCLLPVCGEDVAAFALQALRHLKDEKDMFSSEMAFPALCQGRGGCEILAQSFRT
jgi:hypothetical protein